MFVSLVGADAAKLQRQRVAAVKNNKMYNTHANKLYLHFDPAVYCLEDLSVVDGMNLNQES